MNGEEKANENALSSGAFNGQTAIRQEVPADVEGAGTRLTAWFALRSFQHDALLQVYDCGAATQNDRAVIFCVREPSHGDLEAVLAEGPLQSDEAVELFSAVLRALVFLHAHGHVCSGVEPPDVHACGTRTKLFPQRLRRETEIAEREIDLRSVGELIARATSTGSDTDEIRDRRLRSLAVTLLNRSGSIPNAESALRAFESPRWTRRHASAIAAVVVVLAVFLGTRAYNGAHQSPSTSVPTIDNRPSPIDSAEPPTEPEEPAPAPVQRLAERTGKNSYEQQRSRNGESDWAVIAATYKSFGAAQRRANSLKAAFGECTCSIFPREGDGQNYYVIVASNLTWDAAERARARAVGAGLPEDTYVTRLGSKRAETSEPPQP